MGYCEVAVDSLQDLYASFLRLIVKGGVERDSGFYVLGLYYERSIVRHYLIIIDSE